MTTDNPSCNIKQFKIFGSNFGAWGSSTNGTWELVYDHNTTVTWTYNSGINKNYSPVITFTHSTYYQHIRVVITKTIGANVSNGIIECYIRGTLQSI